MYIYYLKNYLYIPSLSVSSSPNGLKSLLASESSLCSSLISDSDSDILKSESSLSDFESESLESLARLTCLEDTCRPYAQLQLKFVYKKLGSE